MGKKKRQKLRVAFRKNRQKRVRQQNLTHDILDETSETEDAAATERISGKGELTRYRTIVGREDDNAQTVLREVDETKCLAGRVVSAIGLNSLVHTADGRQYECTIRRVVRMMSRDARNAVVTGDHVLFQPVGETQGVIERIDPRNGIISRGSHRREHIIVANVDQVLIVVSADEPPLKPNLIDRFLISAEKGEVDAVICINKADLIDPVAMQPLLGQYGRLGYPAVLTSVVDGTGIQRLKVLLKDRETVIAGQSGVGKSSLLNAIQHDLKLKTNSVSGWTGKGRHTTRRAVLIKLDCGGWVVDTPGIRQFELWDVISEEVEGFFVEFRPFVRFCKYPDCSHTHEDGCGIKQAIEDNLISIDRYESYLKIVSE